MSMMMSPADAIAELFASEGAADYLGEPVTVAEHLLQAGALAEAAGAPPALVAAALLHDVGHLTGADPAAGEVELSGRALMTGTDNDHGRRGAWWLSELRFPVSVSEPVRLHVAAKRYLCATEPDYVGRLSEASVYTLSVQGGPMNDAEARAFEAEPHAADAIAVRRWDDEAKDASAAVPGFDHYRTLLAGLAKDTKRLLWGAAGLSAAESESGRKKEFMEMILCSWCHANNQQGLSHCAVCGAPLNGDDRVSESGFREAPKLRDMEEFTFSSSTLQIEGKYVPMVEINLHPDDSVYFEQHTIMAKDAQVRLAKKPLNGKRRAHGMPYSVLSASGPGFISFSRDAPGELVVMPIHEHTELDVREHAFLLASHTVDYQFVRIKGLANMVHGGNGMYLDQFTANGASGIVLIHGSGDVVQKTLAPGESIYVEAGKLLYKDSSVSLNTVQLPGINSGFMGNHVYVAELTGGPQGGRVGLQSAYHHSVSE